MGWKESEYGVVVYNRIGPQKDEKVVSGLERGKRFARVQIDHLRRVADFHEGLEGQVCRLDGI